MRISDWSSDVCSSDLRQGLRIAAGCDHAADRVAHAAAILDRYQDAGVRLPGVPEVGVGREIAEIGFLGAHRATATFEEHVGGAEELADRQGVVEGKSVTVRVDLGGRRNLKKKK